MLYSPFTYRGRETCCRTSNVSMDDVDIDESIIGRVYEKIKGKREGSRECPKKVNFVDV